MNLPSGSLMTFTGSAADRSGVASVKVQLNNGEYQAASLTAPGATRTNWSITLEPLTGTNTVNVVTTNSISGVSPVVSRSFKVLRPLQVVVYDDPSRGYVTRGFFPVSYREVGKTYMITATPNTRPAPGYVFHSWELGGVAPEDVGLTYDGLYRPTIRFIHRENLTLTATFIPNPFATLAGAYHGLLSGDDNPNTWGLITANVQPNGAFTAKLNLAGQNYPLAGIFAGDLEARFGTNRALTTVLKRPDGGSITVNLRIEDLSVIGQAPLPGRIFCTLLFADAGSSPKPSTSLQSIAFQHYYNGTTKKVPAEYLGPRDGTATYTSILFAPSYYQPSPRVEMPEGFGFASVTLNKAGLMMLAGLLPDGTSVTMSSPLSFELVGALYTPLYGKKGYIGLAPTFFPATGSDLQCWGAWSRPVQDTQHYPNGWPKAYTVEFKGARYKPVPGQSVVKSPDGTYPGMVDNEADPLPPPDANGNALLQFPATFFSLPFSRSVNISSSDRVTSVSANDRSFSISIFRNTGRISGDFINPDSATGEKYPFQGIIYQRAIWDYTSGIFTSPPGAFGYFLTPTPAVKTYNGRSGPMRLHYQP